MPAADEPTGDGEETGLGGDRAPPRRAGPQDGGGEAPRAFAVGYERQSGDMLVYGGLVVAGIGVLAMILNGSDLFVVFLGAGLVSAAYFWPLTERTRPQLGGSSQGLYVDRIGIIGWHAIEGLDIHQTALRTMRLATLRVRLSMPLDKAVVAAERVPASKILTTRNWRVRGNVLEVRLHTLAAPPEKVFERLRAFYELARA